MSFLLLGAKEKITWVIEAATGKKNPPMGVGG